MTLGTAPDPAPNAHDAAARDAADHLAAYMTAYAEVGCDDDQAFHLYCILAARPPQSAELTPEQRAQVVAAAQACTGIPYEWPRGAK